MLYCITYTHAFEIPAVLVAAFVSCIKKIFEFSAAYLWEICFLTRLKVLYQFTNSFIDIFWKYSIEIFIIQRDSNVPKAFWTFICATFTEIFNEKWPIENFRECFTLRWHSVQRSAEFNSDNKSGSIVPWKAQGL